MNYKDYYKVLGVSKSASADEIKQAYRKLAMKFHPDKTTGNKAANERFNEINEAHQVLGDEEKRKKYDEFGADYKQYEQAGAKPGGFDWSKYANPDGNQNQQTDNNQFEHIFSGADNVDLFEMLFGGRGGSRQGRSQASKGEDLSAETSISLEEAYHGSQRTIQLEGQKIRVTIPRGIADEQVLRIAGKGVPGYSGGQNGDLYLAIKIAPNKEFHRKGNDLHGDFPIELYTAMLGGKALVKTLKGAVKVDIAAQTPKHKELRLRGLGMPVFGKQNEFGDLFVTVDIQLPKDLTLEEMELFKKLEAMRK